jgi:subtilisin family serine protease
MEPDEAERLKGELPDVTVLRDRPIDLIRPTRALATKKTMDTADLWHLQAIGLSAARKRGFSGTGDGVTVAVLDTGIDETHPELDGRVSGTATFDVQGWQTHSQQGSVDTEGHGTHVAGLIAGKRVGVAPGASLRNGIMIPGGHGNLSDFVLAIEWVAGQEDIQVMNMSAGIRGFVEDLLPDAVDGLLAVGVLPVIAIGNEGRNRTRSPGNYDSVLSVGASNQAGRVASFSSGGTIVIGGHQYPVPDLVAPGEGVTSCVMGGGYEAWDGTSMATPVVSGIASLVLERWPTIAMSDLTEELLRHCVDLGEPPTRQGAGLVQIPSGLKPAARRSAGRKKRGSRKPRGRRAGRS